MKEIRNGNFQGERALFFAKDLAIYDSVFENGESPLKESRNIEIYGTKFRWKYPIWYSHDIKVTGSVLEETARSGIWYTHGIEIRDSVIDAPKTFRRASNITLRNVKMKNALESMWNCRDIVLEDVEISGDYFAMNSENIVARNIKIDGNYAFDGAKNVEIHDSMLNSKDSFWNCECVTVYNSVINGEYLGWNTKNLRLVGCKITSNQGMCYIDDLVLRDCTLEKTDLAFEYCTVDAVVSSHIDSVKNITSGRLVAKSIGEIIMEEERVDTSKTVIEVGEKNV